MQTPSFAVHLTPLSEGKVPHDEIFDLYSLLLREFIEPIFGWNEDFQRSRFAAEYAQENTMLIFSDAVNVGYVVVVQKPAAHHVALLLLQPEFQRTGIGKVVMSKVVARAKADGKPVTLSCFKSNKAALLFYQRLGFSVNHEEQYFVLLTSAT